jgi:hypothetical protein
VSGTLTGTITVPLARGEYVESFKGSGVVSPFGLTKVKGSFNLEPSLRGTVTLTSSKGNIVADFTEIPRPGPLSITVTKGTKHFKGIVGSGSGSLDWIATTVHKEKSTGPFSLTLDLMVTLPIS